jgi:hypothetical protein
MSPTPADGDDATGIARPRLWCPGVAFVTPQGDVQLGASVGYNTRDPSFRLLPCGQRRRLAYWTHSAWLVERCALNEALIAEHAIILPETLIDQEDLPHAHRWLREQPLLCVSGATWARLVEDGVRVFRIAFDANGDGRLHVDGSGGAAGPTSLTVSLNALDHAVSLASRELSLVEFGGKPSPIDRALRLLTDGRLDEESVMNAFDARSLIEDGYGYRGALEGRFATVSAIARQLRPVDALFGQIFARAASMRPIAESLQQAIRDAEPDAREVPVPIYVTAQRVIEAALRVPSVERLVMDGVAQGDLELPAEDRWTVGAVDPWSPQPFELALVDNP